MPPPRLFGGYRGSCEKRWPDRLLDIIRIKIRHLKVENKWESFGSLNSNELDIEGLKAGQRNELIVPGQNTSFSSTTFQKNKQESFF